MIACVGMSLDDVFVFLDVYDATGWRTFAVPMRFAISFFDPQKEPKIVFDPRVRGVLFHARDGFLLLLPTSNGERLFKILPDVAALGAPEHKFMLELTEPVTVSVDDMDPLTVRRLVDGFRDERAAHDLKWWMTDEQVCLWSGGKLETRTMRSRPATLLTSTGMLFAPMIAVEDPRPPTQSSSDLN